MATSTFTYINVQMCTLVRMYVCTYVDYTVLHLFPRACALGNTREVPNIEYFTPLYTVCRPVEEEELQLAIALSASEAPPEALVNKGQSPERKRRRGQKQLQAPPPLASLTASQVKRKIEHRIEQVLVCVCACACACACVRACVHVNVRACMCTRFFVYIRM